MGMVGGPHSHSHSHSHSKGSGSRGRPYAVILLVAFGAALLGVMLLHKFRERRICNLLLKQRDQDLLSLQLLFQKQKDRNKELEENSENMKATVYSLRTQKMELHRRLIEMESTIDSLRDEQKTIDVALQEKQNEIKMLREREVDTGEEDSHVLDFTEDLKHKEAELEGSRQQLQSQAKLRSVATDDPSNPHEDSTVSDGQLLESGGYKVGDNKSMDNSRRERKSADFSEGNTSRRVETGTHKSAEDTVRIEMVGKQREGQESLEDEDEDQEGIDGGVREVNGDESEIAKDHKEREVKGSQEVETQKPDGVFKSGLKKETETGKHGHTNKIKGKRWRYIARNRKLDDQWRLISKNRKTENIRNSDGGGVKNMGYREFFEGGASKGEKVKGEYRREATISLDSGINESLKHQQKKIEEDDNMEREGKMMKPREFNSTGGDSLREDGEQKRDDRHMGNGEVENRSIGRNPGERMEPEDLKIKEKQEQDAEDRVTEESSSDLKEEYKDETDESEY